MIDKITRKQAIFQSIMLHSTLHHALRSSSMLLVVPVQYQYSAIQRP